MAELGRRKYERQEFFQVQNININLNLTVREEVIVDVIYIFQATFSCPGSALSLIRQRKD